jgi:coenzyme F420-0:L-glutamate ligase/coenzyme F420-1:gamma-L-glutamate ligase
MQPSLTIEPLTTIPLIKAGDDLAPLVLESLRDSKHQPANGDIIVLAQKIVSKAEGRTVRLADVEVSKQAQELARQTDKDPRLVELILSESTGIVRSAPGVIIVRHRLGIVCANAGIDQSNIDHAQGECALLLPLDPDRSANQLRQQLLTLTGKQIGVIVSDSVNRPWRLGSIGIAIGSAGVMVLDDRRGHNDIFGREMKVTMSNIADSIATAALLVMGETTQRVPAALVRGLAPMAASQRAIECIRPAEDDLFL